jgi:hypothetical protein
VLHTVCELFEDHGEAVIGCDSDASRECARRRSWPGFGARHRSLPAAPLAEISRPAQQALVPCSGRWPVPEAPPTARRIRVGIVPPQLSPGRMGFCWGGTVLADSVVEEARWVDDRSPTSDTPDDLRSVPGMAHLAASQSMG